MAEVENILNNKIEKHGVKHRALTGFLRKNWARDPYYLQAVINNCDVSACVGALPNALRERVDKSKLSDVTDAFHVNLQYFLYKNIPELTILTEDKVYDLPELGNLFNTKCELIARGINVYGINPWGGAFGFVCKMSFPEINANYALKLYYDEGPLARCRDHGPWFEIATALAAGHAEPRDNNRVYMAALTGEHFLLSHWAGDKADNMKPRENEHKIFVTTDKEDETRNRRGGRRIDWGETFLTDYGTMSYRARKFYRQIMNLDCAAVQKSITAARNNYARRDISSAIQLASLVAQYDDNERVIQFINTVQSTR